MRRLLHYNAGKWQWESLVRNTNSGFMVHDLSGQS